MSWFISFEKWVLKNFGYNFVVHFEDTMTFSAGIFIGALVMAFLCGRVVFKLTRIKHIGHNVKLLRFQHEGFKQYVADPQSVGESIETLLLVIFRPIFTNRNYDFRDEKRTKIFLIIIAIVGTLVVILAVASICNIIPDNIPMAGA